MHCLLLWRLHGQILNQVTHSASPASLQCQMSPNQPLFQLTPAWGLDRHLPYPFLKIHLVLVLYDPCFLSRQVTNLCNQHLVDHAPACMMQSLQIP